MDDRFERIVTTLLEHGEEGTHRQAFESLGFTDPVKAEALWQRLLPEPGLEAPPARLVATLVGEIASCSDPDMALLNLSRLADGMVSPTHLLGSIFMEGPLCHLLVVIASCSHYLSDILVRTPGYLSWLIEADTLGMPKSYGTYRKELRLMTGPFMDHRRKLNAIKRHKRRELLRIGARDLLGLAGVEEVTAELSFLADAAIETIAEMAFAEETRRAGRPASPWDLEGDIPYHRFAVISLGKLGGTELNYSSDIDLLFVCEETEGSAETDFYTSLARRITNDLTEPTEDGSLYRLDLRLRPDGESGPLVVTLEEHLNFLLRRAQPWQRQALIKARHSAGSRHASHAFLANCCRVIFSSLGSTDPLDEILTMRERSIATLPAREREGNIKLMSGGIRDIEFIAQALQLVHGVHRHEVRSRNTLEALERLRNHGLIGDEITRSLENSYRLFRTVEHRLQMMQNVRTHTLPADESELAKLGWRISNSSLKDVNDHNLTLKLGSAIRQVQGIFDSFFRDRHTDGIPLLLSLPTGDTEVEEILSRYGITAGAQAHSFLRSLVYGDFPRLEGPETLHAAARCLPPILERVAETPDPALTLKNLVRIIKATRAVRSTLELLAGGGDLLRLLLVLASLSSKLTDTMVKRIGLLDVLAEGVRPGDPPRPSGGLAQELGTQYASGQQLPADLGRELTRHLEALKRWYDESILYIHCQRQIPEHGPAVLGPLLSDAVERLIRSLFDVSGGDGTGVAIFALGSLGSRECRYGSDLDLVAVVDDGGDRSTATMAVRRLIEYAGETGLGAPDLRLRGEGEGSPLVQTLGRYRSYFETRAALWEMLAFMKCRFICGERSTAAAFTEILSGKLNDLKAGPDIAGRMLAERVRLESLSRGEWDVKHAPGGLYDIDFLVMTMKILRPADSGGRTPDDIFNAAGDEAPAIPEKGPVPFIPREIERLRLDNLIEDRDAGILMNAHRLYYLVSHAAALHGFAYPPLSEREAFFDSYLTRLVGDLAGRATGEGEGHAPGDGPFTRRLESVRNSVRGIFLTYIEGAG
ncbi:MAG: hypothetical protein JSV33_13405 [bacterium]|nr:MAG: hypothetical protein JSV33_13405 [bacterium]